MEQILNHLDIYSVLATILSTILTIVVPILAFKYRKLIHILQECKKLLSTIIIAWQDKKITEEEMKEIVEEAKRLVEVLQES